MTLRRDWRFVEAAEPKEACAYCGKGTNLEWAHIPPRTHDAVGEDGIRTHGLVKVKPERIVVLCGPATDSSSCHYKFDSGEIDLLPKLIDCAPEKIVEAVNVLGMEGARRRLCPSDYTPHIEEARRSAVAV